MNGRSEKHGSPSSWLQLYWHCSCATSISRLILSIWVSFGWAVVTLATSRNGLPVSADHYCFNKHPYPTPVFKALESIRSKASCRTSAPRRRTQIGDLVLPAETSIMTGGTPEIATSLYLPAAGVWDWKPEYSSNIPDHSMMHFWNQKIWPLELTRPWGQWTTVCEGLAIFTLRETINKIQGSWQGKYYQPKNKYDPISQLPN